MTKYLLFILFVFNISSARLSAQCTHPSANTGGTTTITPSESWQTVVFKSGNVRYIEFAATTGNTYIFTANSSVGGSCNADEQFSILNTSNNSDGGVFGTSFKDDYGSGTKETILWSPSSNGTYRIVMSEYQLIVLGCQSLSSNFTVAYASFPSNQNFAFWAGYTSTAWATTSNWFKRSTTGYPVNNVVPTSSEDVFIPGGGNNQPSNTTTGDIKNLFIYSGATLTVNITTTFNVNGSIMNNGTITHTSAASTTTADNTYWISMKSTNATISGSGNFSSCAIWLNSAIATNVTLGGNVSLSKVLINGGGTLATLNLSTYYLTVSGAFYQSGAINLNSGTLELQSSASYSTGSFSAGTGTLYRNVTASYSSAAGLSLYNYKINCPGYTWTMGIGLTISNDFTIVGGTVDASSYTFNIGGDFSNSGSLTYGTSTFNFNGSSAQQIVGSSSTTFYNLTLSNNSGLSLLSTAGLVHTVRNALSLTGQIALGSNDLAIGAVGLTGTISGAGSSNYIITNGSGDLNIYNIGTAAQTSVLFPVGISSTSYTPLTLAVSGTSTIDNFKVSVSQSVLANGTSGASKNANVVDRTWDITEGTASGSSLTLTTQWNAADELGSFTRSSSYVSHYTAGAWVATSNRATSSGNGPFTRTSGVVTSFSPFAVASNGVLPVELISFNLANKHDKVSLGWSTASELNCDKFIIERSGNGNSFDSIGYLKGNGTTTSRKDYEFIDNHPLTATNFYRLRQIDFDGSINYTEIRSVQFNDISSVFRVQPNPTTGYLIVDYKDYVSQKSEVDIYDLEGKAIKHIIIPKKQNESDQLKVDLTDLPSGIYFIYFSQAGKLFKEKIIKKDFE